MATFANLPPVAQMIANARAPQKAGPIAKQIARAPRGDVSAVMSQWFKPSFVEKQSGNRNYMRDLGAQDFLGVGGPRGNWSDPGEHGKLLEQMRHNARKAAMELIAMELRQVARGVPASRTGPFGIPAGRKDRGATGLVDKYGTLQNKAWEAEGAYDARTNRQYPTPQG